MAVNGLRVSDAVPAGSGSVSGLVTHSPTYRPAYNVSHLDPTRYLDGAAFVAKDAAYTVIGRDMGKTLSFNSATGFTITLPLASSVPAGSVRFVVGTAATSGVHAIDVLAADTIKGNGLSLSAGAAYSLTGFAAGDSVVLFSDGTTSWYVVNALAAAGSESATTFLAGDGTAAAPAYSFANDPDSGWYKRGNGVIDLSLDNAQILEISGTQILTTASLSFGASVLSPDVSLSRGVANRLDLATGDSLYLVSGGLGVGVAPPTAGNIQTSGSVQSGAHVIAATASAIYWDTRSTFRSPADGQLNILNAAESIGVGLDFATDGTLKIRNRAQNADGILSAAQIITSGGSDLQLNPNTGSVVVGGSLSATSFLKSSSATAGIGYSTGAGGTVTQLTSKSTGVTLNTVTGEITMNNAALAADTAVSFALTNTAVAAGDMVLVQHVSAGTVGAYVAQAVAASGSATVTVRNVTAGSLSEAIVLKFIVFKAATS